MALKGAGAHIRRLRKLAGPEATKIAGAIVYEGADMIRAEAFRSISAGAVSGKGHIPSKPGEPPNRDTGNLQAHLRVEQTGPTKAEVRSDATYAAALEFGTSKMAERPYMRPARDKMRPAIQERLAEQFGEFVRLSASIGGK